MGVQHDEQHEASLSRAEEEAEAVVEDFESTEIKMDTIVLPEGVCMLDKAFVIIEKDPDGKKFDKDINIDVYPLKVGAYLQVMLTTTLNYDGGAMPSFYTHAIYKQQTLMDEFEYVCFGKVFKIKDTPESKLQVFASFGGLILRFSGDPSVLEKFQMDQQVYLLTRHLKVMDRHSKAPKRTLDSL